MNKLNEELIDSVSPNDEEKTPDIDMTKKPAKEKRQPSARNKSNLAAGLVVILFAAVGLVCSIVFAVNKIGDYTTKKQQEKFNEYASLLISAAAIDIAPFDDITGADMKELIEMSVWSVISDADDPNSFDYKSGSLVVPASAVEAAFTRFFGTQRTAEHTTVQGYGYEFTYNTTENAYYIPITSLTPIYTPKVTDIEKKGNSVTVTVGLVNSDRWLQNSETGDISTPEPDKYEKVTFREENGSSYISAVRALSAPETATTQANTTPTQSPSVTEAGETQTGDTAETAANTDATESAEGTSASSR